MAAALAALAAGAARAQGDCTTLTVEGQTFVRCDERAPPSAAPAAKPAPASPSPFPTSGTPRPFYDPRSGKTCRPIEISGLIFSKCE